jgi:hypothetical protein
MRSLLPKLLPSLLLVLSVMLMSGGNAQAKDMSRRLGVGFKDNFSTNLPSLAMQYYVGPDLGLSGVLGVDTQQNNSKFGMMARIQRIVFHEDNLHFYMGAGAGLISVETNGSNQSGFELAGFAGTEFFFSGLENVGFSFEMGVGVTSLSSSVRFRTIGDSPMRAGMTFYF